MIKVSEIIIVEGKHDKVKLASFIDGTIITTNGFRIFKDKKTQKLLRDYAKTNDIIILTDSDSAGFVIRNFLKSILPCDATIKNAYLPQVLGKEKRKESLSKEGYLGVEGFSKEDILNVLENIFKKDVKEKFVNKQVFFKCGLSGCDNSSELRLKLINKLDLPTHITTNALIDYINANLTKEEFFDKIS